MWREKAKECWLMEGDENTHYFHISTIAHRRYNHIHHIFNNFHIRISDPDDISQNFVDFYTNLFQIGTHCFPSDFQGLISSSIEADLNRALLNILTNLEIKRIIFSMQSNKSLGPDGMGPTFYKHFQGKIGSDVVSVVQSFFHGGSISHAVNHTFITLIPKRTGANKVEQFCPIALCNVIYKVISKLLASRLKPFFDLIIHQTQSTFIPNRATLDNIIINHEVMNYLNSKKGKTCFMAIKVDMTKAYDMVEWDVIQATLLAHGFSKEFSKLVYRCISTAFYSILVNGTPYGSYLPCFIYLACGSFIQNFCQS